jgi:hypothetical protein
VAGLRRQPLGAGKALQRVIRGKQLRGDRHQRGNDRYRPGQQQAGLNAQRTPVYLRRRAAIA